MKKRMMQGIMIAMGLLLGALILFYQFKDGSIPEASASSGLEQAAAENPPETTDNTPAPTFTLAQLQEDYEEIRTTMMYFHPKLYTDPKVMDPLLESQYKQLKEGMTAIEFYRVVAPIIAASRCGHTYIGLSDEDNTQFLETAAFLPFSLYWHEGQALVNANALIPNLPLGSKILSINGVSIQKVLEGMLQNISSDGMNQTMKLRAINDGFRYHYAMAYPTPDEITLSYQEPKQSIQKQLTLRTVSQAELRAVNDAVWGMMGATSWVNQTRFEKDHAVLRMASFYPSGSDTVDSYKAFIDGFFRQVKQENVQNVILDIRDNFGGDPNVAAHLLSYLEKKEVPYFDEAFGSYYPHLIEPVAFAENRYKGNLYVLMNGNSFSTSGHLLGLLKYHGIGTLIGEESGGSFACSDASESVALSHTSLRFKSSRTIFKVAVKGLKPGQGILPDYPVTATLEDLLSKKDVEMTKALELIRQQ